jgi:hypothetical protein
LGGGKWGAGPAVAAMHQAGRWTYGVVANHLWDFAGSEERSSLNATYLQPFVSYTFPSATSLGMDTQSTYDWQGEIWTVPINFTISQMVKLGNTPVNFTLGGRYYAETPAGGPDWGMQFSLNVLLPERAHGTIP